MKLTTSVGALALAALAGACASSSRTQSTYNPNTQTSPPPAPTAAPTPDPRVGLKAGWFNAGEASWNMRLVSTTPPSPDFIKRDNPGDFSLINSDVSFRGNYVIQVNFSGVQVW